jgi:hypothetical protein
MCLLRAASILLASAASPADGQQSGADTKIGRLEPGMRGFQRKVLPGGYVEPEIQVQTSIASTAFLPRAPPRNASKPLKDLTLSRGIKMPW